MRVNVRLLGLAAALITLPAFAQVTPPPQPGDALVQQEQQRVQLERAQQELGQLFDRLAGRMGDTEDERQEVERLRGELERLLDEIILSLPSQVDEADGRVQVNSVLDRNELQVLPPFEADVEGAARRRALSEARLRLQALREDVLLGTDRERSAQALAQVRGDLEVAYAHLEGDIQGIWTGLRDEFDALIEGVRGDEDPVLSAEAHAQLLERLQALVVQERLAALIQTRTRLMDLQVELEAGQDVSTQADRVSQLRNALRWVYQDAEGEDIVLWNNLRSQLFTLEDQLRAGDASAAGTLGETLEGLPETAPGLPSN